MVRVQVTKLGHDGEQRTFVVILQEVDGPRLLPIWIGKPEAEAIAAQLHGIPRERPMTHDLAKSLIGAMDATLRQVVITRVEDHTYFAEMHVETPVTSAVVDARPSDAIAIALRCGAPIYAADDLLDDYEQLAADAQSHGALDAAAATDSPAEELRRHLQALRPEDFGKFSL